MLWCSSTTNPLTFPLLRLPKPPRDCSASPNSSLLHLPESNQPCWRGECHRVMEDGCLFLASEGFFFFWRVSVYTSGHPTPANPLLDSPCRCCFSFLRTLKELLSFSLQQLDEKLWLQGEAGSVRMGEEAPSRERRAIVRSDLTQGKQKQCQSKDRLVELAMRADEKQKINRRNRRSNTVSPKVRQRSLMVLTSRKVESSEQASTADTHRPHPAKKKKKNSHRSSLFLQGGWGWVEFIATISRFFPLQPTEQQQPTLMIVRMCSCG